MNLFGRQSVTGGANSDIRTHEAKGVYTNYDQPWWLAIMGGAPGTNGVDSIVRRAMQCQTPASTGQVFRDFLLVNFGGADVTLAANVTLADVDRYRQSHNLGRWMTPRECLAIGKSHTTLNRDLGLSVMALVSPLSSDASFDLRWIGSKRLVHLQVFEGANQAVYGAKNWFGFVDSPDC